MTVEPFCLDRELGNVALAPRTSEREAAFLALGGELQARSSTRIPAITGDSLEHDQLDA
jgi:hypothetical protein